MRPLLRRFLEILPVPEAPTDGQLHLLSLPERVGLRRATRRAMGLGAAISLLCNGALFLGLALMEDHLPSTSVVLPSFGPIALPWGGWIWMTFWILLEIALLVLLNVWSVQQAAVALGYVRPETRRERVDDILRIAMNAPALELSSYGINPFQGVNRYALWIFNTALALKGMVLHKLLRVLLLRVLGRYALRLVLDLAGLPIYATINALGVRAVMMQARVIIAGERLVEVVMGALPGAGLADGARSGEGLTAAGRDALYDALQLIAMSKRDFHRNHLTLTRRLLEHFEIPPRDRHVLPGDYQAQWARLPGKEQRLCVLVVVLGFILDGRISRSERRRFERLRDAGVVDLDDAALEAHARAFVEGRGADALVRQVLGTEVRDAS